MGEIINRAVNIAKRRIFSVREPQPFRPTLDQLNDARVTLDELRRIGAVSDFAATGIGQIIDKAKVSEPRIDINALRGIGSERIENLHRVVMTSVPDTHLEVDDRAEVEYVLDLTRRSEVQAARSSIGPVVDSGTRRVSRRGAILSITGVAALAGLYAIVSTNAFQKEVGVTHPVEKKLVPTPTTIERAKEVLGQDFLGVQAINIIEEKLKAMDISAKFDLKNVPPFPYTENDLSLAKANGEMLILRTSDMSVRGEGMPVTLENFRDLFRSNSQGIELFRSLKGTDKGDWFRAEDFFKGAGQIHVGWSMVKKSPLGLDGTLPMSYYDQAKLLDSYKKSLIANGADHFNLERRTPMEAVWDFILYYSNTDKKQLPTGKFDWTATGTSFGYLVAAGYSYSSKGIDLLCSHPHGTASGFGVCPSR